MWSAFPEHTPEESGYYFTEYYNPEQDARFFKAIWFDAKGNCWVPWKRGVDGLIVYRFIAESRNDYYVPCMMWARDNGDRIP